MSAIVDWSREAPGGDVTADVCIIGSGPGGATAAWELARAGRDVVVLEEGGDFTGTALTMRDAMYDRLYMERGGRSTDDLAISVLQGRVLGGGSVINAADVVPIPDGVLRHWQKRHGLSEFSPEALAPYRRAALEDLHANFPRADQVNDNNSILRAGAAALGWRGEVMMHNREGCAGLGKCMVGCPLGAKKNARFVAIPGALAAGARVMLRARAVRIEGAGGDVKTVHVRTLDPEGRREVGEATVRAKVVVLAANAVASAQLLLRSGVGNAHVGRHLSLQPQLPVTAVFDRDVRFFQGIPQSYAVTEFENLESDEHGWWGFRIEGIGGTPGVVATGAPMGDRGKAHMKLFPRIAMCLLLVPDEGNGTVTVGETGRPVIAYSMPDEQKQRYRDAAKAAARLYLAAGAARVMVPGARPVTIERLADLDAIDRLAFEPATAPFVSAHQQGSVRFAPSPASGAADPSGQVYGTRGVYVFDSSGYPTSSSSHTMTPIVTTSRYLARRLVA
jgi:choline dehydrogenase-like flavoprotein